MGRMPLPSRPAQCPVSCSGRRGTVCPRVVARVSWRRAVCAPGRFKLAEGREDVSQAWRREWPEPACRTVVRLQCRVLADTPAGEAGIVPAGPHSGRSEDVSECAVWDSLELQVKVS